IPTSPLPFSPLYPSIHTAYTPRSHCQFPFLLTIVLLHFVYPATPSIRMSDSTEARLATSFLRLLPPHMPLCPPSVP
uniref:Uncharacterized protein n=1 Tax=Aegilops tauschii subsp. strangulata TaxID=200361 RepID=A0A452YFY7_AEGTS